MYIREVNNSKLISEFHQLPYNIYSNDDNWIPHLKQDIEKIFHTETNKYFDGSNAKRWLLKSESGKLIGRIAAFIHPKTVNAGEYPTGGIGFFECINDQQAADKLFDTAKLRLKSKGIEAMDGPVNFGERDQFWGLLIKNFSSPPTYGMNYNPEYYGKLFENYGFKEYFRQFMYHRMISDPVQDVFENKAKDILSDEKFECKTMKNMGTTQVIKDFVTIYNEAWGETRENFKSMTLSHAEKIFKALKPVADPNVIFFAYYAKEPIGFYINIPEMNHIFKHVNGNLDWFGKLIFLYKSIFDKPKTLYGLVFGVTTAFHGKGVEGAIIKYAENIINTKTKYKDMVITWIGDFNPKMLKVIQNLGAKQYRTFSTMRYLFDESKEFERAKIVKSK
ncbi:MAG: hypothetical protein U9N85_05020 [Bacteroidota bacterium]|nr:hypothetical protein [Bacteroidota bacterium]